MALRTVRFAALAACALLAPPSVAAPADTGRVPDGGPGFHLEGRPEVDDVFGDTGDYRRTVDRFLELTAAMQAMRDDFARSVQAALSELAKKSGSPRARHCPVDAVAVPYARAHRLGVSYLQIGRELTRHYEEVKEYDRLGESVGLTPDYRWKVKRVLVQFNTLLTDYREMKVAFHDQLTDELKYAGCDLGALLYRGDPQLKTSAAPDAPWPQPGKPGAPGVSPPLARAGRESPPSSLPAEQLAAPQPIPLPKSFPGPAERDAQARAGVIFYVDNTRCQRGTQVVLDGKRLGDVPGATRVGFQTVPGPHDLCLIDDGLKKQCGAPGTIRRSYLHEGWTISLRCE